eukprot:gene19195-21117_t
MAKQFSSREDMSQKLTRREGIRESEIKCNRMEDENQFANKVAKATYLLYESIGKKGKPQKGREWTLLASFLKTECESDEPEVICLATGSKCIGKSQRVNDGRKVNDSHAEMLARRLLLRYFYDQLTKVTCNEKSIFTCESLDGKFSLKPGVRFHFFTSHTPCGDASIFPKVNQDAERSSFDKDSSVEAEEIHKKAIGSSKEEEMTTEIESCERFEKNEECNNDKKRKRKQISKDHEEISFKKKRNKQQSPAVNLKSKSPCLKGKAENKETFNKNDKERPSVGSFNAFKREAEGNEFNNQYLNQVNDSQNSETGELKSFVNAMNESRHVNNERPDIYRTGAKCVPSGKQDPHLDGSDYHITGTLRTKPGRGERTLSMSCSDKIMKWCTLGLQGGLLSKFLQSPIFMSSIVIGKCPFSNDALMRALSLRGRHFMCDSPKYLHRLPQVYYCSDEEFVDSKSKVESKWVGQSNNGKVSASGSAIVYCKEPPIHEVIVNGLKQGTTKKRSASSSSQCAVSKSVLFAGYKSLLPVIKDETSTLSNYQEQKDYRSSKLIDPAYRLTRETFFKTFPDWIEKPGEQELFF